MRDRRLAGSCARCQELPGQELFQYLDEDGARRAVDLGRRQRLPARDQPGGLHRQGLPHLGRDGAAALALQEFEEIDDEAGRKKRVVAPIEAVAERLGNTPAVCRACYVHPDVIDAYLDGSMVDALTRRSPRRRARRPCALPPEEAAVLGLLQARLAWAPRSAGRA